MPQADAILPAPPPPPSSPPHTYACEPISSESQQSHSSPRSSLRSSRRSSHRSSFEHVHRPSQPQRERFRNRQRGRDRDRDRDRDRERERERERPKKTFNLATMANTVRRPRDPEFSNAVHVRYIAQVDLEAWMLRRTKVGPSIKLYVVLEATILSVSKSQSGPRRYQVNVRSDAASVSVERAELLICLPENPSSNTKFLRLQMASTVDAHKWKRAIDNAVSSEITDYYTLGPVLGSGAYGEVVKAFDVRTNETRAVKIIKRGNNMKIQQHLENELEVMKSISHPNIVQTYQIFDLKRTIYIVMEHVSGGDLFDFVSQHSCLTENQARQTMHSIFEAVEYLHSNGIVHRDLKPENILCANQSWPLEVKVTDFGFASFLDPTSAENDTLRTQVGTVYFMAPEIISNKGHGPAVDAWACGVILYTILTGRLPFPGKNTPEYFSNVLKGRPSFPAVLWKGISPDAMSLVKQLLNPDPNKRTSALGALHHPWLTVPSENNEGIRRDRSNLHSKRRKLFKARKVIIAVAMASKFKATIPQMVDLVGDSTKKAADGIGQGVKMTADGVKKVGDGIGEGTKKVASEIGTGTKKVAAGVAGGTKKVAEGIGTGVKRTVDGVEIGARKVGEGVKKTADGTKTGIKKTADGINGGLKKTADGIETGLKKTADGIETGWKKTADGIETGLKKTADGIETGWKKTADGIETGWKKTADGIGEGFKKTAGGIESGLKKTGEGIKNASIQAVDLVKVDRNRENTDSGTTSRPAGSQSTSNPGSERRRPLFRRRGPESQSSAMSASDQPIHSDIPTNLLKDISMLPIPSMEDATSTSFPPGDYEPIPGRHDDDEVQPERPSEGVKHLGTERYSSDRERTERDMWTPKGAVSLDMEDGMEGQNNGSESDSDVTPPNTSYAADTEMQDPASLTLPHVAVSTFKTDSIMGKKFSNVSAVSNGTPPNRPKLAPLDGFPIGLSDGSATDAVDCDNEGDTLRMAAALLLAAGRMTYTSREGE